MAMRKTFQPRDMWPKARYRNMAGSDAKTKAEETEAEAPNLSDSDPARAPPATPPTSKRMDRFPASCMWSKIEGIRVLAVSYQTFARNVQEAEQYSCDSQHNTLCGVYISN